MRVDLINVLPEDLPVSLLEAKAHVRIDYNKEDDLINDLIRTATEYVERYTGQALITREITMLVNKCSDEELDLLYSPIVAIDSVSIADGVSSGSETYTATTNYVLRGIKDKWIDISATDVKVVYDAGYGTAADVPLLFKEAILKMVFDMWEHRGESVTGTISQYTKQSIARLLYSHRKTILC